MGLGKLYLGGCRRLWEGWVREFTTDGNTNLISCQLVYCEVLIRIAPDGAAELSRGVNAEMQRTPSSAWGRRGFEVTGNWGVRCCSSASCGLGAGV
jgi:hypothetical protein